MKDCLHSSREVFRVEIDIEHIMANTRNKPDLQCIVKDTINELFSNKEFVDRITKSITMKVEQKLEQMEKKITTLNEILKSQERIIMDLQQVERDNSEKIKKMEIFNDRLQQDRRRNNICIHGVSEEFDDLKNGVIQLIKSNLQIDLTAEEMLSCFRVGISSGVNSKPKTIIIKLAKNDIKIKLMKNSYKLKGSKMFITEDLTMYRRKLLMEAKEMLGFKNVWTSNGSVFTKLKGKYISINASTDIAILLQG